MMAELFASGRVVELILGLAVLEAAAMVVLRRGAGRGPGWGMVPNLAAGAALLLALRLAIGGAWWGWLGLCLAAAGLAHAADLRLRWRQSSIHQL